MLEIVYAAIAIGFVLLLVLALMVAVRPKSDHHERGRP